MGAMTDDGNAPTIPETQAPTHNISTPGGKPRAPDDRYVLRSLLGSGGMGEVWLAHDVRIDRDIAIKLMRGTGDPDATARFLREARVQGRLEHPSVVPVHDLGGDDASPYFAMKRLAGTTLAAVITGGDPQWTRRTLLARFVEVCLAVEFAHQRGVIHRDLKPANIMLGDFGETYVLDWGLARIAEQREAPQGQANLDAIRTADLRSDSGSGGHTQVGAVLGTPGYMAPEQMRGEAVDRRTDVYALGCILFEILAGTPAIPRDRSFEVTLNAPSHRPAQRNPDAEIPPELDDACARATAADPTQRIATARGLANEVSRFLDGDRDLERRRELAGSHAVRAQAVFAERGDDGRAEAMREAGRAIALDPHNNDAQRLLARLLLEPPKVIPAAARDKIAQEREATGRAVLRAGRWGYAPFLVVVPLVKLFSGGLWPFVELEVLMIVQIALCTIAAGLRGKIPNAMYVTLISLHLALLASLGVFLGPLLLLPVMIFGTLTIFLMMPAIRMPGVVLTTHALALAIPLGLEWLGVLPSSYHFEGDALVLQPWAIQISPHVIVVVLVATVGLQLMANAFIVLHLRRDQERAQEQVHVQTWQLAQLVATDDKVRPS